MERELGPLDHWVLSGAVGTWTPTPALRYSLHAFLWLPSELRIERIVRREREQYGDRILPGGDMAEVHAEFIAWTRGYDDGTAEGTNTLPCHEELLRRATNPVLRLSGPIPVEEAVERVLGEIRR
ncbi:hypothetical protein AKJ09_11039 [Labilithrix luteola]|uniref:Uncharacterized protein n=1 Tax=Labilithrix luteola TaxID=1391654 RepID=A0A0K1QF29_9BACT|nr:hypothetical protein AKJ09_11039 [Labilithrix luteola]